MNKRVGAAIVVFAIFIVWFYYLNSTKECIKARMAFDLGSGAFKSEIALVNVCKNKLIKVIDDKLHPLKMADCLLKDEVNNLHLSDTCIDQTMEVLADVEKTYDVNCQEVQCIGVATEWARQVDNEEILFEKLRSKGLHVQEIEQEKEGIIAFNSVVQDIKPEKFNLSRDDIVVWDLGGASFQISTANGSELAIYNGRTGVQLFDKKIRELVGRSADGDKPFFTEQEVELILANADSLVDFSGIDNSEAYKKLKNGSKLVTIGAPFTRLLINELEFAKVVNKSDLLQLIEFFEGKKVEDIKQTYPKLKPAYLAINQSSLILIYLIMTKLEQDSFTISDTTLTRALFTMEEFW